MSSELAGEKRRPHGIRHERGWIRLNPAFATPQKMDTHVWHCMTIPSMFAGKCGWEYVLVFFAYDFGIISHLIFMFCLFHRFFCPSSSTGHWALLLCHRRLVSDSKLGNGARSRSSRSFGEYCHRIGWWENLQENPIFDGKNHGFL